MKNVLPHSGRVLIVDNDEFEAKPIMDALSKSGIPYLYYTGEVDGLPEDPMTGVRILFLDLYLQGLSVDSSDAAIVSKHIGVFNKIINIKGNGPLIVVFWSDKPERCECVKKKLLEGTTNFIEFAVLGKGDYSDGNLDSLTKGIVDKINKGNLFKTFLLWENAVAEALSKISAEIVALTPDGQSCIQVLGVALNKLDASVAPNNADKVPERFRRATHLYNQAFINKLEEITGRIVLSDDYKLPGACRSLDSRQLAARLNTFLGFELWSSLGFCTGAIRRFLREGEANRADILSYVEKQVFTKDATEELKSASMLCELIITPRCDVTNDGHIFTRTVSGKVVETHHVMYGLLIPDNVLSGQEAANGGKRMLAQKETLVKLHPFEYKDGKIYHLVFSLRALMTDEICRESWNTDFVLKNELLLNIQAKAANELNRPGEPLLEVK